MKLHGAEIQYKCGTNSFMNSPRKDQDWCVIAVRVRYLVIGMC